MAVAWWCLSAWRAAGSWTWVAEVGEIATCWASWWGRRVMSLALTWLRVRYHASQQRAVRFCFVFFVFYATECLILTYILWSCPAWSRQETCGLSHERVWFPESQCWFCPGLHWGPDRRRFGEELIWYHHVRTFSVYLFVLVCCQCWNVDLFICHSSNCVVNLSPDKKRVLAEAYAVLKVQ